MFSANRKPRGTTPLFCAAAAIAVAALFFCARADAAKRDTRMLPGTVSNFELPNFNENSGAKEWELFGDKATYISDEHIDIDNMKLNLFEGAQKPELKAVMTSPNAQVNAVAQGGITHRTAAGKQQLLLLPPASQKSREFGGCPIFFIQ